MAIAVERERRRVMPGAPLHDFHIVAALEQDRYVQVTEIVRANRGDAGLYQQGLPAPPVGARRDRSAVRHGEDMATVAPARARLLALSRLALGMGLEEPGFLLREIDAARAASLRCLR